MDYFYIYLLLIVCIVVVLIVLFVHLAKTMKKVSSLNNELNTVKDKIELSKQKKEAIEKTRESFNFFFSIGTVILIVKETFKASKKNKESIKKSFTKTCIKNRKKISKIKI